MEAKKARRRFLKYFRKIQEIAQKVQQKDVVFLDKKYGESKKDWKKTKQSGDIVLCLMRKSQV